jgi:hypothetical protein
MEKLNTILKKKEKDIIEQEELIKSCPWLFNVIGEEIKNEDGSVIYKNEKMSIQFKFKDFSDEYLSSNLRQRFYDNSEYKDFKPEDYYMLTEFKIRSDNSNFDLISENKSCCIIFKKNPLKEIVGGQYDFRLKLVELNLSPSSPAGILTLLHEIGHLNDNKLEYELNNLIIHSINNKLLGGIHNERIKNEEDTINLRKERYAWSYALKKVKPFISDLGINNDSLEKFIHNFSIGSYCK